MSKELQPAVSPETDVGLRVVHVVEAPDLGRDRVDDIVHLLGLGLDDYVDAADANIVAGDIDIIVEAEAGEVYDVINSVATEIRSFDDVNDTKTYVCLG